MSDTTETTATEHEAEQVERANATGLQPVVFIHGLWLLPSSWDRWATRLRGGRLTRADAGLARRSRDRRGGQRPPRGVRRQDRRPGRRPLRRDHRASSTASRPSSATPSAGCSRRSSPAAGSPAVSVAIDPAPFRGVLPLPISALRSARPVLGNPANRNRADPAHLRPVPLRVRQRRQRGGGQGALRDLRRAGPRRAAVPGRGREPQPVDRGEGRHARTPTAARC